MRRQFIAATLVWMAGVSFAGAQNVSPPKHPYDITPDAGAWTICVNAFFEHIEAPPGRDFYPGELEKLLANSRARQLAIEFVSVLRRDYKLPAYMFNRGDEERKKEEERVERERKQREELFRQLGGELPKKTYRKRLLHIQDQYIVLIGGYPDQDTARRDLDRIRKLDLPADKKQRDEFQAKFCRRLYGAMATNGQDKPDGYVAYENPFKTAMVLPNPLVPRPKPAPLDTEELERGLAAMNANNPYSLLKHAGKWTLVVKTYRVPTRVVGLENTSVQPAAAKSGNVYDAVAKMAEELAKVLRHPALNLDAYVLHTHNSSLVTVGIFDSEKDPRLLAKQSELSKLRLKDRQTGVEVEQLMNPPLPIPIPRSR